MELKNHITDEKIGIGYTLCGDYYLPDISLPEDDFYDLGRFGKAKFRYLQRCQNALLTAYQLKGTLVEYLRGVDESCEETFSRLVKQYAEREGVTEQLKAENQMKWVGLMNNIRIRVEEIVMKEFVYEEE